MSAQNIYKIKNTSETQLILNDLAFFKKKVLQLKPSRVIVIYDKKVKSHLKRYSKTFKKIDFISLNVSESLKSFKNYEELIQKLIQLKADKKTVLIAMGGGVVGDLVGFVASTYLRGVPWISVPTTLLAQVDSGIGGKNGINTVLKNSVGTVYQPKIILLDPTFLKTLSQRDFESSLGEIIKYNCLDSSIRLSPQDLKKIISQKQTPQLSALIYKCAKIKMKYVLTDPLDQTGLRQKLNLGHTFAHALEKLTNYKKFRHGEAVLLGLKFALIVSYNKGFIAFKDFRSIMLELNMFSPPALPKHLKAESFYKIALSDKKSHAGTVYMVLIQKRGRLVNPVAITKKEFVAAFGMLKDFEL